jgi:hypothetical protein
VLHVVFPRPEELDGSAHLLRDLSGLQDEVALVAAAEAAAHEGRVDSDLLRRELRDPDDDVLGPLRPLGGDPGLRPVGPDVHRAVHRLHGGVGLERQLVDGVDLSRSNPERGEDVAVVADDLALLLEQRLELLSEGLAALPRVLSVVPLDLERLAPLHRGPGAVGHDRDAAGGVGARVRRDLDDVAHAGDGLRLRGVEARGPAPNVGHRATTAKKIPGTRPSRPKRALPSTFDGISTRGRDCPTIRKSFGFLRGTVLRLETGSFAAASTSSP